MKSIIQCYTPEEIERIARGEQTVKVCKTAPKEVPFKVYMYCTNDKHYEIAQIRFSDGLFIKHISENTNWANGCTANIGEILNGKVVGEYVCERVEECIPDYNPITQEFYYNDWEDCSADHLTSEEETAYGKGKTLRGLHITAAKFYDEPKALGEFKTIKCTNKRGSCSDCKTKPDCIKQITRPPQGWQYVEEI